jgi:hypothetical protein
MCVRELHLSAFGDITDYCNPAIDNPSAEQVGAYTAWIQRSPGPLKCTCVVYSTRWRLKTRSIPARKRAGIVGSAGFSRPPGVFQIPGCLCSKRRLPLLRTGHRRRPDRDSVPVMHSGVPELPDGGPSKRHSQRQNRSCSGVRFTGLNLSAGRSDSRVYITGSYRPSPGPPGHF